MTKTIREFSGTILSTIEEMPNGDKLVRNIYGRILTKGDCCVALLFKGGKFKAIFRD